MPTYKIEGRPADISAVLTLEAESDYEVAKQYQTGAGRLPRSINGRALAGFCSCGCCQSLVYFGQGLVMRSVGKSIDAIEYYLADHVLVEPTREILDAAIAQEEASNWEVG